ncbi:type II toxin-antitoxin system HipA family toxin [Actinomycetaceae bacterium WB03_NA08]|uniref:Type II toxin-antitoxin system HipA family toxin n=1 Tax=Scrofimicrobium canadense TaxID=2652290 RepID=A0A6N7W2X7_9ACTO|nr:HipA domain-containing protein [Scrofimicrobium canadense]MSS83655.1 type II toxin-antitoxin system HipA family toxin [Scrofimicrobium canadense]
MERSQLRFVADADVYKQGALAATLHRDEGGTTTFVYDDDYVGRGGAPVALSLRIGDTPVVTPSGGLPPFFAGLLPEGFRLSQLIKDVKTSPDDELSLLLAVGQDTPGDVQVVPHGAPLTAAAPLVNADEPLDFSSLHLSADTSALPGVQAKASSQMVTLPTTSRGASAILKLTPKDYPRLVHNEAIHLSAAKHLGFPVAQAHIVHDKRGEAGLLVRRFDRHVDNGVEHRLPLEDAGQIMGIVPAQKYSVNTEELILAVANVAAASEAAKLALYTQFVFSWLTGNGDLHAKNVSLLQTRGRWQVSPLYDVVCTLLYGDDTMALPVDGRTKNLRRRHWDNLADAISLPPRARDRAITRALRATSQVNLEDVGITGSPLNGTLRELRYRRSEIA